MGVHRTTVRISLEVLDEIKIWLQTKDAKRKGLTNASDVVNTAVLFYLDEQKMQGFFFRGRAYKRLRSFYTVEQKFFGMKSDRNRF